MGIPYKCPICFGRGKVEYNFYNDKSDIGINEECRGCKGSGVLWDKWENNNYTFTQYPPIKDN